MILFDFKEYSEKLKHVVNFFWHLLPAAVAETQLRINKIYCMVFLKIITYLENNSDPCRASENVGLKLVPQRIQIVNVN